MRPGCGDLGRDAKILTHKELYVTTKDPSAASPVVVLLSGGLDSSTTLAMARDRGQEAHALTVRYGQRHDRELQAASEVATRLGAISHRVMHVDLGAIGGSALTDPDISMPQDRDSTQMAAGIPVTYVPARNTVMLSLALGLAEVLEARSIYIGVNAVDYSGYPDCRPEFLAAFERLASVATRAGVEGAPLRIEAPLLRMTKADIVHEAVRLGVPLESTWTCYEPAPDGRACSRCDACILRLKGFEEAGERDPLAYA